MSPTSRHSWIALFRGINVGGNNIMPMAQLRETLEAAGCQSVRSYIQSGNVVLQSSLSSKGALTRKLLNATEAQFGFRPNILLLSEDDFRDAIARNPFAEATDEPKSLHFFFLESAPKAPDMNALQALASPTERYALEGATFYLHAPDGIGRSKLAAGAERKLGVPATARNYNTVRKLRAMIDEART